MHVINRIAAFHDDMTAWVHKLVFYRGPGVACTLYRSLGAIFVNETTVLGSTSHLAEELLHEASHTRLYASLVIEPAFDTSDTRRYTTPLRPDARPMLALVHQVFVLVRIVEFYGRLVLIDPAVAETYALNIRRLEDAGRKQGQQRIGHGEEGAL